MDAMRTPLTIAQAQQHARQLGVDRLDAQLLLCEALQQGRAWLLAHDTDTLTPPQQTRYLSELQRRAAGEPLAYIVGEKEFFGLTLQVSRDVLVPRPDTETLVEWALSLIPDQTATTVLDLGTGSGAIALAIQHARPKAQVTAVDASEPALQIAQNNARVWSLPVRFRLGSWLAPVAGERFDLIVSNPPYIAEGDPHMAALGFEPKQALTSGPDGLEDLRQIIATAPANLQPGGWLLLEHGYDQAVAVAQLLRDHGFSNVSTRFDLGGQARCTGGQRPA
ncbi:MAG TPA: peptide chain release factor N(5)-glutamine methyltransferase [Aquabacterium sp.]|uniref:peptide chain release factor N(5)-glutamine methyltransferase n=1 Tax=Aquabacterium sp. TaxID=1872578 RepID=UPI002E33EDDD|nr:peptide chain release factor N(5)-glutamine methyltransferase [Aquabacterium sp.]HEX5355950.1 peptide chain release factor N(5)-glutamine methyltransferase [Aquabacterium sp.]